MPDMTSSDFTTLMMFLAGLAAIVLLVGLRYSYLLHTQERHVPEPLIYDEHWQLCEKCGVGVPTMLFSDRDNPFRIRALCAYCALCSDVEPFILTDEQEEPRL